MAQSERTPRQAAYRAQQNADALAMLKSPEMDCLSYFRDGLERYLVDRIPTGSFMRCILENDWVGAVGRAHPTITMDQMRALHHLLVGAFPINAWGSPEKVAAWLGENESAASEPN